MCFSVKRVHNSGVNAHSSIAIPWWKKWMPYLVAVIVAIAVGVAIVIVPTPFVVYGPGPTFNVLGSQNDTEIIEVASAQSGDVATDDADRGELRMVTVYETGGPGSGPVNTAALVRALITSGYSVKRYSDVYPQGISAEQVQEASQAQMTSSHSTATVAALRYLGYDLPTTITIAGTSQGTDADGKFEAGDVLKAVKTPDGVTHSMDNPDAPFALMRTIPAGSKLQVEIERAGQPKTIEVLSSKDMTAIDPEKAQGSKLGIILDLDINPPLDVTFHLDKVGGPSAGTMFALGVIDKLTGKDLTGGKSIAGTGALSYDGVVQPIGGIQQKLYGAKRDGAEYFLAPAENCNEVVGHVPDGLDVYAITTLPQAVDTVTEIAEGKTDDLLTCEAVL